ncbi:class I SAM-dependent methyltransferase [Methylotetracoccus oryzae]|uniref:class I SAM-dependent methyltransferase n=1 Tax=Methylotetracoccus oryzae TaxID=1919059 RepID=UPI0013A57DE1|nr:class I SAM-dependent methyltransferase [Methylotetracoccus oryzae]
MLENLKSVLKRRYYILRYPPLRSSFRVKSDLTYRERLALYRLANDKKIILEIGSYLGASACCFAAQLKARGAGQVICVDTWNNDAMSEGGWDTFAQFVKNTAPFLSLVRSVRGFSTDVVETIRNSIEELDLLFIDGDHSYQGVKSDWEAYKKFLKPGSVVVFHDWGWADGVKRVVNEDVLPLVDSVESLPNMWWGTIKG